MQLCLGILTVFGLYFVSMEFLRRQLLGWILMLAAQPFWLATTWMSAQWGMFLVSVIYTLIASDKVIRLMRQRFVVRRLVKSMRALAELPERAAERAIDKARR